jgi:hypothetical protein
MVVELDKEILTSEITSTLLPLIMTRDEENIVRVRLSSPSPFALTSPLPPSRVMMDTMRILMLLEGLPLIVDPVTSTQSHASPCRDPAIRTSTQTVPHDSHLEGWRQEIPGKGSNTGRCRLPFHSLSQFISPSLTES